MDRFKQNLKIEDNKVFSYNTHVATITKDLLEVKERYVNFSVTTSKHIRYVASEYDLKIYVVGIEQIRIIKCPNCDNWEKMPADMPRNKSQHFKHLENLDNNVAEYRCNRCNHTTISKFEYKE